MWFEASESIGQHDPIVVDVVLPKGELKEPSAGKRFGWFLSANTIVLLPLVTLAAMLLLRALKRLPVRPDYVVVPRYEPPAEMTPAEIANR